MGELSGAAVRCGTTWTSVRTPRPLAPSSSVLRWVLIMNAMKIRTRTSPRMWKRMPTPGVCWAGVVGPQRLRLDPGHREHQRPHLWRRPPGHPPGRAEADGGPAVVVLPGLHRMWEPKSQFYALYGRGGYNLLGERPPGDRGADRVAPRIPTGRKLPGIWTGT